MNDLKSRLLKDPLVHFIAVGFLLFTADLVLDRKQTPARPAIELTESDLDRLIEAWRLQWRRAPTQAELDSLVDAEIREQVFYREALVLGLDENDTIIRRRLSQKLEFLIEAQETESEVPDSVLEAFYADNEELYQDPARFTFAHVFYSTDGRENPLNDAQSELTDLKIISAPKTNGIGRGDSFYPTDEYNFATEQTIARDFGANFVEALKKQAAGEWSGPIESGLGWHIVFLEQYEAPRQRDLNLVRDRVQSHYLFEHRRVILDEAYRELRKKYDIHLPDALNEAREESTGTGAP